MVAPPGIELASIIWRDNANRTFASGVNSVELPPLNQLAQASEEGAPRCNVNCDRSYHVGDIRRRFAVC